MEFPKVLSVLLILPLGYNYSLSSPSSLFISPIYISLNMSMEKAEPND